MALPLNGKRTHKKMLLDIPIDLHANLKSAAKLTGLNMTQFVLFCMKEKIEEVLSEEFESDKYVPAGLRSRRR
jgi:uncharacterized protein (DUF1778 family)